MNFSVILQLILTQVTQTRAHVGQSILLARI